MLLELFKHLFLKLFNLEYLFVVFVTKLSIVG